MNAYVVTAARPAGFGLLAFGLLLAAYFGVLTVVSGWTFTVSQFSEFWYYILPLGAGFGLQVALYTRLRQLLHQSKDARTVMWVGYDYGCRTEARPRSLSLLQRQLFL